VGAKTEDSWEIIKDTAMHNKLLPDHELPDNLYIGFVDSLLKDVAPIFFAALAVTAIYSVAAIAARSTVLLYGAALQLLVAAIRLVFLGFHARNTPSASVLVAARQESRFAIGAICSLTALSLWTFAAFCLTDDNFTRFLGATTTISFAFGMQTRAFAIYRGINLQLVAAFVPLAAAFVAAGGWYPLGIVVGYIPLILFMKGSSNRVRANFLEVIAARARLDLALNNMSHGLVMIDARGRLGLVNSQVMQMFGLNESDAHIGADPRAILRSLLRRKIVDRAELDRVSKELARNPEDDSVVTFEIVDNRAMEITAHRMREMGNIFVVQDVTERRNAARAINRLARIDSVTGCSTPSRDCSFYGSCCALGGRRIRHLAAPNRGRSRAFASRRADNS
jgi:PAS domain S-box-containing protein